MRLLYAPTSPFARKARISILELGLAGQVELVPTDPWTAKTLRASNPLAKVPVLQLPDGVTLYDSPVICEFLDTYAVMEGIRPEAGRLFPQRGPQRWRSLRRQALGDGFAEAIIRRFVELRRPAEQRSEAVLARQDAAIEAVLDVLEQEATSLFETPSIGEIAIACALSYYDFRYPEAGWRGGRSDLARWFAVFDARPSMQATRHPAI